MQQMWTHCNNYAHRLYTGMVKLIPTPFVTAPTVSNEAQTTVPTNDRSKHDSVQQSPSTPIVTSTLTSSSTTYYSTDIESTMPHTSIETIPLVDRLADASFVKELGVARSSYLGSDYRTCNK
jgi:hypothetical protein